MVRRARRPPHRAGRLGGARRANGRAAGRAEPAPGAGRSPWRKWPDPGRSGGTRPRPDLVAPTMRPTARREDAVEVVGRDLRSSGGWPTSWRPASQPSRADEVPPGAVRPAGRPRLRGHLRDQPDRAGHRGRRARRRGGGSADPRRPRRGHRVRPRGDRAGLRARRGPQGRADRRRALVAVPRGRHRARPEIHQGASPRLGRERPARRSATIGLEQPGPEVVLAVDSRARSSGRRSATT